jgi:hypothetical protein
MTHSRLILSNAHPLSIAREKRRLWNRIKRLVSNKPVSLLFRIALPALSVAVLFYTLETAQREQHAWIAGRERAAQTPVTNNSIESIPFVLPFQHGPRIQDAIGFLGRRLLAHVARAIAIGLAKAHPSPRHGSNPANSEPGNAKQRRMRWASAEGSGKYPSLSVALGRMKPPLSALLLRRVT